jgi:hypothetical protein
MARRRQSNFFEDVMELVSMLPWWAGFLLALVSYLWLHDVATQPVAPSPKDIKQLGESVGNQLWITFAIFMQYIIPTACVLGASISAFKQHKKSQGVQNSFSNSDNDRSPQPQATTGSPECPVCGSRMVKRTAKKGGRTGETFWGCSKYPGCRGTRATT